MDEGWLIKQAQMGDNKAFELLIDEHFKKIYNIAYRLSGNEADASDMTQEVLIKIFRHIQKRRCLSWLYIAILRQRLFPLFDSVTIKL